MTFKHKLSVRLALLKDPLRVALVVVLIDCEQPVSAGRRVDRHMNWDKVQDWIRTLGLVAIPFVLGITANRVAESNAIREVDAKMIEIAARVLTEPPNDSTRPVRDWARKVLEHYSEVPFSDPAESIDGDLTGGSRRDGARAPQDSTTGKQAGRRAGLLKSCPRSMR